MLNVTKWFGYKSDLDIKTGTLIKKNVLLYSLFQ